MLVTAGFGQWAYDWTTTPMTAKIFADIWGQSIVVQDDLLVSDSLTVTEAASFGGDITASAEVHIADSLIVTGSSSLGGSVTLANGVGVNEFSSDGTLAGNSDLAVPTEKAVKHYADSVVTAQDLDIAGDTGTGAVDLDSQILTIAGTTNQVVTVASNQTVTLSTPQDIHTGASPTFADMTISDDLAVGDSLSVSGNIEIDSAQYIQWNSADEMLHSNHTMTLDGFTTWDFGDVNVVDFDSTVDIHTYGAKSASIEADGMLDLYGGTISILAGAENVAKLRRSGQNKYIRFAMPHFDEVENVGIVRGLSTATDNILYFGGADNIMLAPTSIRFNTADNHATTKGTEVARFEGGASKASMMGLGNSALEDWHTSQAVLQIGKRSALNSDVLAGAVTLSNNTYFDQTNTRWEYLETAEASVYSQATGTHFFRVVASGTAGDPITWVTALTIANDASSTFGGDVAVTGYVTKGTELHAYGGFQDSAIVVSVTTPSYSPVTNATGTLWGASEVDGMSMSGDTLTITNTGDYVGNVSLTFSGGNGDDYLLQLYNVTQTRVEGFHIGATGRGANNFSNIAMPLYMENTAGDEYVLRIANITDSDDPTVRTGMFTINYLHD